MTGLFDRHCEYCGTLLVRRVGEQSTPWKKRRFCGYKCMGFSKVGINPSSTTLSNRAKLYRKSVCEGCGGTDRLATHHIDRDRYNNSPENLKTLCTHCHLKLHWEEDGPIRARKAGHCSVCGEPIDGGGRGLCNKHYLRWKRWGHPLLVAKSRWHPPEMEAL
jgi:hypothetical protein